MSMPVVGNVQIGDSNTATTSVVMTMPNDLAAGKLITAVLHINAGSGNTVTKPADDSGTWTFIKRVSNDTTGVISTLVYQRVCTGSEAGTYTWTLSASSTGTSWECFSSTNQTDTYNDFTPTGNSGMTAAGSLNIPVTGATTATDNVLAIAIVGVASGTYTPALPSGWTDVTGGNNGGRGFRVCTKQITTAGTNIADAVSSLSAADRYWTAIMIGIRSVALSTAKIDALSDITLASVSAFDTTTGGPTGSDGATGPTGYAAGLGNVIFKTSDTVRNNTATLAGDPHLTTTNLDASSTYLVRVLLMFNTTAAADFKATVVFTNATDCRAVNKGIVAAGTATTISKSIVAGDTLTAVSLTNNSAGNGFLEMNCIAVFGSGVPSMAVQWAQDTQDASDTTLYKGSLVEFTKVA